MERDRSHAALGAAPAPHGGSGTPALPLRGLGPLPTLLLLAFGVSVLAVGNRPLGWRWAPVAACAALVLGWSRTREAPRPWSLAAFLGAAAFLALGGHAGEAPVIVLVGTALAIQRLPDRPALAVGAASLALSLLGGLRQWLAGAGAGGLVTAVTAYAVGYAVLLASRQRLRHQWDTELLLGELREEHRRLEAAHAELAERARDMAELAASEERNRIAREIHDVLAHALTTIIVQAEAAAVRLRADPPGAAAQVAAVATLARQALEEARLSVAAVRADPGRAGLDALRRLCADAARLGGMRCELVTEGEERPLPAPVTLTAYRILQEALTNAARHGHAGRVQVAVAFSPAAVTLTVSDDGRGAGEADSVAGSGLRGMRERAAALGGGVTAGPLPGGGFRVRAELPCPDTVPAGGGYPA